MTFQQTLHFEFLWRLLYIVELYDIEPILSFYTQLVDSYCFPDITLFGNIILFSDGDIKSIEYKL